MEIIAGTVQHGEMIQLGLFESVLGLLSVKPVFLAGLIIIGVLLAGVYRKRPDIFGLRLSVLVFVMYYYLYLMFTNVVGIPTWNEWERMRELGEKILNPRLNLIPFVDGVSAGYILNVILFIPLGVLCPMISRTYECIRNTILFGVILSCFIELSQLLTLYRASDIDDLSANLIGTVLGYLCFRMLRRLRTEHGRKYSETHEEDKKEAVKGRREIMSARKRDIAACFPVLTVVIAFGAGFFS